MSSQSTWRSNVSFSDSASSYRAAFLSVDVAKAQAEAKSIEDEAYRSAKSKEEYEQLCQTAMDAYGSTATATEDQKTVKEVLDHIETSSASVTAIGSYVNAIYYREGICSTVYKAADVNGRPVALKLTRPSAMTAPHDSEREGRILKQCANSHVIALTDTFRQPGGYYVLAFPFMPHDLDALLGQKVLSLDQVKSHLRDLFSALEYLHSMGIIHRDIKPSNILLASPSGPAYLADFGIAWSPDDKSSEPADHKITDVGTTSYRPPELLFGNAAYDCSLDLWAAGCVVAEAVRSGGRTFFDAGALGSELALIQSIFKALGTPNLKVWPEAASFPDWGKMEFYDFPLKPWAELLPSVPTDAIDLVRKLLRYQSSERLAAAEVGIYHPWTWIAPVKADKHLEGFEASFPSRMKLKHYPTLLPDWLPIRVDWVVQSTSVQNNKGRAASLRSKISMSQGNPDEVQLAAVGRYRTLVVHVQFNSSIPSNVGGVHAPITVQAAKHYYRLQYN